MDVSFYTGICAQVVATTNSVAEVAALTKATLRQRQSSGQEALPSDPHAANHADLGESVARLQDHVQTLHRELHFQVDEVTGQTVVRVVDSDTGELVRQMPSQAALDTLQTIETLQAGSGLLLREQA